MPIRRRYAACLRDMDYYLRYATYAMVAGNMDVLWKVVLQGLRKPNSLECQLGQQFKASKLWRRLLDQVAAGVDNTSFVDEPFDYMTRELSEKIFSLTNTA